MVVVGAARDRQEHALDTSVAGSLSTKGAMLMDSRWRPPGYTVYVAVAVEVMLEVR